MSAIVDAWMEELGKLKDKIQARRPFLGKQQDQQNDVGAASREHDHPAASLACVKPKAETENEISEDAIFLLMERFVPW
ncbi:hypothetical protein NMG60_11019634 [Bertholletia excelsa]